MAPFHDQIVTTGITLMPAISHFLGRLDHLLGRLDEAEAWFTEAMAQHRAFEAPLLVAYTEAAFWASMLADRRAGDDLERVLKALGIEPSQRLGPAATATSRPT